MNWQSKESLLALGCSLSICSLSWGLTTQHLSFPANCPSSKHDMVTILILQINWSSNYHKHTLQNLPQTNIYNQLPANLICIALFLPIPFSTLHSSFTGCLPNRCTFWPYFSFFSSFTELDLTFQHSVQLNTLTIYFLWYFNINN